MPDINIPDAAVEAACHRWRRIGPIIGTGDVRLIVAAAAPYIAAQALRDAADAIEPTRCRVQQTCHKADAITLRARADRIEDTQ